MGETCHFQFRGPESGPPPQARFSGKIPEQGEDDFPPKPARPDLAGGNGRFRYLCPQNWNGGIICLLHLWAWEKKVSG